MAYPRFVVLGNVAILPAKSAMFFFSTVHSDVQASSFPALVYRGGNGHVGIRRSGEQRPRLSVSSPSLFVVGVSLIPVAATSISK